ncbi:hypothetical protein CBY09_11855 [Acidovorax kalamii]|uniref:Uncharacterized protein n=1 Tax=Acidovorax kalamii TaxID=2004485 RepID=A0A235EKW3_9BURK|nr:hypothetical protein CBY09_11855 [Acidovorax kalamii]
MQRRRKKADNPSGLGVDVRTCSKSFRGSHWSAIGMSGCFGCAAWARAHASSRSIQSPDFTPTLRASALPGGLRRCGACG